jgi:hypothetical protein
VPLVEPGFIFWLVVLLCVGAFGVSAEPDVPELAPLLLMLLAPDFVGAIV